MTLLELAERCEAATGPDRELDCAIYNAVPDWPNRKAERLPMEKWEGRFDDGWRTMWADREDKYPDKLRRYTASIDVARTLIPEWPNHGGYRITHDADLKTKFFAELWEHPDAEPGGGWHRGRGASLPLAICAAALRAIAAAARQSGDVQQAPGEAPQSGPKGSPK